MADQTPSPECVLTTVSHRYYQHPEDRRLFVCVGCGHDLECTCDMTEAGQANCEVHGYDGIEL
jgi:hypothetical protein